MNQSAKQPVGTSKFTRPAHERFTDTKTTLTVKPGQAFPLLTN